jgi:hypothetical protein
VLPADEDTANIAGHLIGFLQHEVSRGRMPSPLPPLQAGIGTIANAVLAGFVDSPFEPFSIYSEVLQDSTFDLMDAGKVTFASGASITLSEKRQKQVFGDLERGADGAARRSQRARRRYRRDGNRSRRFAWTRTARTRIADHRQVRASAVSRSAARLLSRCTALRRTDAAYVARRVCVARTFSGNGLDAQVPVKRRRVISDGAPRRFGGPQ